MRYWIFQAIPERYVLDEKMTHLSGDRWLVTRYVSEIAEEDVVYFWQAGKAAALHGWGVVRSPEPFITSSGDHRVEVSYEEQFDRPIPKSSLKDNPGLRDLQLFRAPQGTNFKVSEVEAAALNEAIRAEGFSAPPSPQTSNRRTPNAKWAT